MRVSSHSWIKMNSQNHDWSEKTILVAEDVPTNYMLIEAVLCRTKVNLIWARNGQEAVEKCLDNQNIDLVLMDIQMPVMNGMEATRSILKFRNSLPIIAQTAFTFNYEAEKIRKVGCREVLTKPISPEALISCIHDYFKV
jgi:two-component system, cell cycle response regulator DivK